MSTLVQTLIGGVPTLVDVVSIAREVVTDTNGTTALVAGQPISAVGGTIAPADAPTSKFALGYVLAAVLANAAFSYYTDGVDNAVSGLTKGADVFLGAAGAVTTTPPEPASGGGWQRLGIATSTTAFSFVPALGYARQ